MLAPGDLPLRAIRRDPVPILEDLVRSSIGRARRHHKRATQVSLRLDPMADTIQYEDDAGGVTESDLVRLIRPDGRHDDQPFGIDTERMRTTIGGLGQTWRLESAPRHRVPFRYTLDDDSWLGSTHTEPAPELEPDHFGLHIQGLRDPVAIGRSFVTRPAQDGRTAAILTHLGKTFAPFLQDGGGDIRLTLRVAIGDHDPLPVGPDPQVVDERAFLHPPGIPPTHETGTLERVPKIRYRITCGFLSPDDKERSGGTLVWNDGVVHKDRRDRLFGFGVRGKALVPAKHPATKRFAVHVTVEDPDFILPLEDPSILVIHPALIELRSRIHDHIVPYFRIATLLEDLDLLPYTSEWWKKTPEEKERQITRTTSGSTIEEVLAENPQLVSPPQDHITEPLPVDLVMAALKAGHHQEPPRYLSATLLEGLEPHQTDLVETLDLWQQEHRTTVTLPRATFERLLDTTSGATVTEAIEQAVDEALARKDGIWAVPDKKHRPLLQALRNRILEELPDTHRIGVFGSVAKGTADEQSDIDILVVHDDRSRSQTRLNEIARWYLQDRTAGRRHRLQVEAITPEALEAQKAKGTEKSKRLFESVIWIHPTEAGA